jgi:hypothetical protein
MTILDPTMQQEGCVAPILSNPNLFPRWHDLAKHEEPNWSCKINDLEPTWSSEPGVVVLPQKFSTRIIRVAYVRRTKTCRTLLMLSTRTSAESTQSLRAKVDLPSTKRMLEALVRDLNTPCRDEDPSIANSRVLQGVVQKLSLDEDEFKAVLHARAGGARYSHNLLDYGRTEASLTFVSPDDDWPYICFIAVYGLEGAQLDVLTTMLVFADGDPLIMDTTKPNIVIQYLGRHIDRTLDELDRLGSIVEDVERIVQEAIDDTTLTYPIKQLHDCNLRYVRLRRRWTFQKQLMAAVDLQSYRPSLPNFLGLENFDDRKRGYEQMSRWAHFVGAAEPDLEMLPRRIENQFTAV